MLEAARRAGHRRIVFSSSAGIFGELKTLPIAEDHPQDPDSPYGASKLAAEKMCLVYNKLYGMRNVCLRYFNVYGVNQRYDAYGNVIPIFADRILRGEPMTIFGDGEQTRDFVNVARRRRRPTSPRPAPATASPAPFNIGSGTRITINELARLMQRGRAGARSAWSTRRRARATCATASPTSAAAHAAFGFEPTVELEAGPRGVPGVDRDTIP